MGGHAQLLLLDEVSTALDRQGRETFVSLIRLLEREMKILVITHDDHLKEEFDHIITVKRVGSDSTLTI
jgi:ABC-type Mn2+/Zn2+ transport system ATPase subunit